MVSYGQLPSALPGSGSTRPRPRFSVVIPARNEEALIGDCLASLARQDYDGPYEVIVVDNASTDRTAQVARSQGAVVVSEDNPGVCWARQRGTLGAEGEIIVSTDADTTFAPGWLSRIDRKFREDPSVVAVAGPCVFVDAPPWGRVYARTLFGLVHLLRRVTGKVRYVTATNLAFRRTDWPGYDTSATQGGDELGLLRGLQARGKVAFDLGNPTFTSSRRLRRGFAYNVLVTFLFYYLLGYTLNRVAGRPVVGMAPPFRGDSGVNRRRGFFELAVASAVGIAVLMTLGRLAFHLMDPR